MMFELRSLAFGEFIGASGLNISLVTSTPNRNSLKETELIQSLHRLDFNCYWKILLCCRALSGWVLLMYRYCQVVSTRIHVYMQNEGPCHS